MADIKVFHDIRIKASYLCTQIEEVMFDVSRIGDGEDDLFEDGYEDSLLAKLRDIGRMIGDDGQIV